MTTERNETRMFLKALGLALLHLLYLFATVGATIFVFSLLQPITGMILALLVAAIVFIVLLFIYARVFWKMKPMEFLFELISDMM